MNTIKIEISGRPGSGTGSVAYLIKECLRKKGFDIEYIPDLDIANLNDLDLHFGFKIDERVDYMKLNAYIQIERHQTSSEKSI